MGSVFVQNTTTRHSCLDQPFRRCLRLLDPKTSWSSRGQNSSLLHFSRSQRAISFHHGRTSHPKSFFGNRPKHISRYKNFTDTARLFEPAKSCLKRLGAFASWRIYTHIASEPARSTTATATTATTAKSFVVDNPATRSRGKSDAWSDTTREPCCHPAVHGHDELGSQRDRPTDGAREASACQACHTPAKGSERCAAAARAVARSAASKAARACFACIHTDAGAITVRATSAGRRIVGQRTCQPGSRPTQAQGPPQSRRGSQQDRRHTCSHAATRYPTDAATEGSLDATRLVPCSCRRTQCAFPAHADQQCDTCWHSAVLASISSPYGAAQSSIERSHTIHPSDQPACASSFGIGCRTSRIASPQSAKSVYARFWSRLGLAISSVICQPSG